MTQLPITTLFEQTLQGAYDDDAPWQAVNALRELGSPDVFEQAKLWCASITPLERARAADVLAQLGCADGVGQFDSDSEPILQNMLERENDAQATQSAICALGHIGRPESLPIILSFASHPDCEVRFGVAFALGSYANQPATSDVLIRLMDDSDDDVRDWATFALGELGDADTLEIREALIARVADDSCEDVRMGAFIGLGKRRDLRIAPVLLDIMAGNPVLSGYIEATNLLLGWDQLDDAEWRTDAYKSALQKLADAALKAQA